MIKFNPMNARFPFLGLCGAASAVALVLAGPVTPSRAQVPDPGRGQDISEIALVLLWIGALKFTAYEANGIAPLVPHSPPMSWGYKVMSMQAFSMVIGTMEIALAVLIATRAFAPKASALGSLGARVTFLLTLSFLLTTPAMAVWQPGYGFPALSPMVGQFLIKDIVLLGAAAWSAGEALLASQVGAPQEQSSQAAALAGVKL